MSTAMLDDSTILSLIKDGFTGVNTRLDKLNGKVAEHEARFHRMDGEGALRQRTMHTMGYVLATAVGAAATLGAVFLNK